MMGAALEHLLILEGYEVGAGEDGACAGPMLLLASAPEGGLHVFETRNVANALAEVSVGGTRWPPSEAVGIHAFLPEPFGSLDVLRLVRAVGGFDGRRKGYGREKVGSVEDGEVGCERQATTGW